MASQNTRVSVTLNSQVKEVLDEIIELEGDLTLQDLLRGAVLRSLIFWWLRKNFGTVTVNLPQKEPITILNELLVGSMDLGYFDFNITTFDKSRINLLLPAILKSQIEAIAYEQLTSANDLIREAIYREIILYKIKMMNGTVDVKIRNLPPTSIVNADSVVNLNPEQLLNPNQIKSEETKEVPPFVEKYFSLNNAEVRNFMHTCLSLQDLRVLQHDLGIKEEFAYETKSGYLMSLLNHIANQDMITELVHWLEEWEKSHKFPENWQSEFFET